jgi:hypothetical protein
MSTSISDLPGPSEEEFARPQTPPSRIPSPMVEKNDLIQQFDDSTNYYTEDNSPIHMDHILMDQIEPFNITKTNPSHTPSSTTITNDISLLDYIKNELTQENFIIVLFLLIASLQQSESYVRKFLSMFKLTYPNPTLVLIVKVILLMLIYILVKYFFLQS